MTNDTSAKLMKWPSLNGERINPRDGAISYTVMQGTLRDCIDTLRSKPQASHHLYEVHMPGGVILSASDAVALMREKDQPPPEEDYGGGDFVSVQREPSTDDDQPLD